MNNHYSAHLLFLLGFLSILTSCASISTTPMHDSIYPSNDQDVTYTLNATSDRNISEVFLYERVDTVFQTSTAIGNRELLNSWTIGSGQRSVDLSFTKVGGYAPNTFVNYTFEVRSGMSRSEHTVSYAIRPYIRTDQAVPVYCQGDPDYCMDIVFIPDSEIIDPALFRTNCSYIISNTIHREANLRMHQKRFNYYINPYYGKARSRSNSPHGMPENNNELGFMEAKAILHLRNNLQNWAMPNASAFSCHWTKSGVFLHESGHVLFNLKDEYPAGVQRQLNDYPNVFRTVQDAENHASSVEKDPSDVAEIVNSNYPSTDWYKLCTDACGMRSNRHFYDTPCAYRIFYVFLQLN